MKVALVVPHIFMHREILPKVIFSPGMLALDLANGLADSSDEVTLFTPGPVDTTATNVTADLSLFERELAGRGEHGDSYLDLLKKHPFTFVTLARQVQSELIAKAFAMANRGEFDVVHIYTNEEDTALPFAALCQKPVVFTHHDPFNFLVKYKSIFPKYKQLNWLSMSYAQRLGMPEDTNWVGNIYHGLATDRFKAPTQPQANYLAFLGRIIQPKGAHLAIDALKLHNRQHDQLTLKIAGKHYSGDKDSYWQDTILPQIDGETVSFEGFISNDQARQEFLGNARALIVPSTFEEPFGMVIIEALACGTPVIGLNRGAIGEIIEPGKTGLLVEYDPENPELATAQLAQAIADIGAIDRLACRQAFEARFSLERMISEHRQVYQELA